MPCGPVFKAGMHKRSLSIEGHRSAEQGRLQAAHSAQQEVSDLEDALMTQWHESQAGHGRKAPQQPRHMADLRTDGLSRAGSRAAALRRRPAAGCAAQEPIVVGDAPEDPQWPEAGHRDPCFQALKR